MVVNVQNVRDGQTYKLTNAKGGTVVDLSGQDRGAPITGYNFNGGANQKWTLEHSDSEHWRLKNQATGLFVGLDKDQPENGRKLIATDRAAEWQLRADKKDPNNVRLFLKDTQYCLDLSDNGNKQPGTPITLWKKWDEGMNQAWMIEEGELS
ncbi:ricin B-like lectin [Epithele typhae]|uniref:ricin B-like lectin n=1 Tax=Epithele typhae TaxID=378194 RepID=UPI0020085955|nr:ricin B-like lectin [Epithele typhae]KAH9914390.1 ricin B-like lectin [Epithele typhae]